MFMGLKISSLTLAFSVLGSFLILFLVIPVLLLYLTTPAESMLGIPYDQEAVKAIFLSLVAATTATGLSLIFGIPLAFILARYMFFSKSFIEAVVDLPLVIPHSVAGIAVLVAYSSRSTIGSIFSNLGIVIEDTFWGIVAAMTFVSATILINAAKDGFQTVDKEYEYVARTLGAPLYKVFFTVYLPLSFKPILSGAIMTWARAMSEVGAILIVAYFPKIAPILIIDRFLNYGLSASKPIACTLLTISIAIFIVLRFLAKRR